MGDVSDEPFVPPNARLCVLSYTVRGAQRRCPDWEQRRMATLFPVTGPPFPRGLGEGQGQQPHTIAPGTKGASSLWGREGHWEERAGGLFLEGSQAARTSLSNRPACCSHVQLGSRLQRAGMRPGGTSDLPSGTGTVRSWAGAKAGRVQISAAGAWAVPAGSHPLPQAQGQPAGQKGAGAAALGFPS